MKYIIFIYLVLYCSQCIEARIVQGFIRSPIENYDLSTIRYEVQDVDSLALIGGECNKTGAFRINSLSDDSKYLRFYSNEHNDLILRIPEGKHNIDFGSLTLRPISNDLDELVVEASRTIVDVDNMTIIPDESLLKSSTSILTALDCLMLPGLSVNPILQTSEIYGKGVIYRVNGIKRGEEYVMSINPTDILKIEYSTSISIRDATSDSGGVINIILKKREYGLSLYQNLFGSVTTGMVNENFSFIINNNKSVFSLSYGSQFRRYNRSYTNSVYKYITTKDTITRTVSGIYGNLRMLLNDINFTYNYTPNEALLFSLKLGNYFGPWSRTTENRNDEKINSGKSSLYTSELMYRKPYCIPSLDLYLKKSFSTANLIEANILTTYNKFRDMREQVFDYQEIGDISYMAETKGAKWSVVNDFLWSNRIGKIELRLGAKDIFSHISYTNSNGKVAYNNSVANNNNLFIYGEIKGKIKKLGYTIGTGLYHTYTKDKDTIALSYLRNYSIARWQISPIRAMNISGAIRFSPQFPNVGSLDDVFVIYDDLTASKGNPNLAPSETLEGDVNYTYSFKNITMTLRGYYGGTWNPIYSQVNVINGYFTNFAENGIYYDSFALSANIDYRLRLNKEFSLGISGFISYGHESFENVFNMHHIHSALYLKGKLFMKFHSWSLSIQVDNNSKSLYGDIISTVGPYSHILLDYQWKSFIFSASLAWIGCKDGDYKSYRSLSTINPSIVSNVLKDNSNTFGFSITYRFNTGKHSRSKSRSLNNQDRDSGVGNLSGGT